MQYDRQFRNRQLYLLPHLPNIFAIRYHVRALYKIRLGKQCESDRILGNEGGGTSNTCVCSLIVVPYANSSKPSRKAVLHSASQQPTADNSIQFT